MPLNNKSKVTSAKDEAPLVEIAKAERMHAREEDNISIHRHYLTRSRFDLANNFIQHESNLKQKVGGFCLKTCPRDGKKWQRRLLSLFPFIGIMRTYSSTDLVSDLIAGFTVGIMHIPQGMAYGFLANIDPVYGLYTSFFAILVYFFFGTSRHISIGVFAVVSLMVGNVVDKAECSHYLPSQATTDHLSTTNYPSTPIQPSTMHPSTNSSFLANSSSDGTTPLPSTEALLEQCKLQHALVVTFLVGVIQLVMGICRVGLVTAFLSEPLTRAFTTGASVHVMSSQIKHVFGINPKKFNGPFKIIYLYWSIVVNLGDTNWTAFGMCLSSMVIIYCTQRFANPALKKYIKVPIPSELIVMVVGTLISYFCHFSDPSTFAVKVLGDIPKGIPPPQVPHFQLLPNVVLDAVAIAIVTFTINISMASMFSAKHAYKLESNQELIAYGITNICSSFFNSYVSAASLSRSVVQDATGGKTQIAGIVSSMLLLVVLLFIGPYFYNLPNCILAAVIIVNLKGIFMQVFDLTYLRKISLSDSLIWVVTFVSVVLLDVDLGLLVGVTFSFLTVVVRNQATRLQVLGNIGGTEIYVNTKDYANSKELAGLKVFSLTSPLFFANADTFGRSVACLVQQHDECTSEGEATTKGRVMLVVQSSVTDNYDPEYDEDLVDVGFGRTIGKNVDDNSSNNNNNSVSPFLDSIPETPSDGHQNTTSSSLPLSPQEASNHLSSLPDKSKAAMEIEIKDVVIASSIRHVIIDFSQVSFVDVVGIEAVDSLNKMLSKRAITLSLASCNREVYAMLKKAMQLSKLAKCQIFVTLHDAVTSALT